MNPRHAPADQSPCSEALWESFRYLSGEMTTAETEAFEARLEHDLAAGEHLAQAVLLTEAVTHVPPAAVPRSPIEARPLRTRRWVARLTAVAGAGLLLVTGWFAGGLWQQGVRPALPAAADLAAAPAVGNPSDGSMLDVWVSLNAAREPAGDETSAESASEPTVETDVPDWIFAALLATGDVDVLPPGMDSLMEGAL